MVNFLFGLALFLVIAAIATGIAFGIVALATLIGESDWFNSTSEKKDAS